MIDAQRHKKNINFVNLNYKTNLIIKDGSEEDHGRRP